MGLLDDLMEDKKLVIKKLSGEFNLNKFVVHDMRNLSHCTQIVIDLKAITDTEEELINAITAFKSIYNAKFVIIAEGLKGELLKNLINIEIYNLITAETIEEIKKEIEQCVIGDGMTYQDCLKYMMDVENPSRFDFKGKNIKIAVAGVMPRIGTTTIAMSLANYLAGMGAKVGYVESNTSGNLKLMSKFYDELSKNNGFYEYKGIGYYIDGQQIGPEYNCLIYDIGKLTDKNLFKDNDINILCAGSKPHEIWSLYQVADIILNIEVDIVFSFASYRGKTKVEKLMGELKKNYYYVNSSTDFFDGNVNKEAFDKILAKI